jgi:hypothetical protein
MPNQQKKKGGNLIVTAFSFTDKIIFVLTFFNTCCFVSRETFLFRVFV